MSALLFVIVQLQCVTLAWMNYRYLVKET